MQEWKVRLLALQGCDLEREALRREMGALEEGGRALDQECLSLRQGVLRLQGEAVAARRREEALAEEGRRLAAERLGFQGKTAEIRKNDEYRMAMETLERHRRLLEENEEAQLAAMEEAEEAEGRFRQGREEFRLAVQAREERKGELARRGEEVREALRQREEERTALAAALPAEVLREYQRLLGAKCAGPMRPWAVDVQQGVCQRCRREVTLHKRQEVARDREMQTCDYCGAILLRDREG